MKNILIIAVLLFTSVSFAQKERALELNKTTDLIDVVYYHDNGMISQTGSYTIDGKLQGDWLSYDTNGKKIVYAQYDNGKKVGTWYFYQKDVLQEVNYTNNRIVEVTTWNDKRSQVVSNN